MSNRFYLWHNRSTLMSDRANPFEAMQRAFCGEKAIEYVPSLPAFICGFAIHTSGQLPINGLRHSLSEGTTGWFVWCGEVLSSEPDFFKPIHTAHIYEQLPQVRPLLGLQPGYRFLIAPDFLDVWFDGSLLQI